MNIIPPYDPKNYFAPNLHANQMGNYLRCARITSVDIEKGLCEVQWLDHPGTRRNVVISLAAQGIYDMPTPGTIVLIAFDKGYNALIVRTLSQNLPALNGTAEGTIAQMRKLQPGDKLFVSFRNIDDPTHLTPTTSGAEILLANTGDIIMNDINGQFWHLDPQNLLISQSCFNHKLSTEAGVIDFGLVKRDIPNTTGQTESHILSTAGTPIIPGQQALTEFRLRVTGTSDTDLSTPPEIDNPLVELTVGTKVRNDGTGLALTDSTYAAPLKEIIIQLKTSAGQGFEFTVDKDGNLTVKVGGDVKFDVTGKADIAANTVNVTATNQGTIDVKAGNVNVDAQHVKLAGDKGVVLDTFISKFNTHTHICASPGTASAPTTTPALSTDISTIVKVK